MAGRARQHPEQPAEAAGEAVPARPAVRGHAYYADLARRTLGVSPEPRLASIPYPIIHAALGVAACATAVALRPGAVGLRGTVIGVSALCLTTALILTIYDRLVYPAELRPPAEEIALPVAALGAFSLVLAGTDNLTTRAVTAGVTVAIWGGLPHLGGIAATGREGWVLRFLRDAASIAVLVPVVLASTSAALPLYLRAAVVLVGVTLVTLDGLRTEAMRLRNGLVLAGLTGLAVSLVMVGVVRVAASPGAAASMILMVWYGLRGVAGSAIVPPRRFRFALEQLAVVGLALIGVYWVTR